MFSDLTTTAERWGVTTTERWAQPISCGTYEGVSFERKGKGREGKGRGRGREGEGEGKDLHRSYPISSCHAPGLSPRNWETEKSLWCELDSGPPNARENNLDTMRFFQSVQPLAVTVQDADSKWLTVWAQQDMKTVRQYLESKLSCNMHVRIEEEGNWMHIRLPTREAYHACLAMNGDVLFGKVMIGVQVCRKAHILDGTDGDKPLRMKQPTSRHLAPSCRWLRSLLDFLFDL